MKKVNAIILFSVFTVSICFLVSCNSESSSENDSISTDSVTIAKGEESFLKNCSSCHNFKYDGIGPQLGGVTSENSVDWVKSFISDPKKMIDAGDKRALDRLKRFKAIMPSFAHLPEDEIHSIIAFLHTQKKRKRQDVPEDTNDIRNPIPDTIQMSNLSLNLELFTQLPATSDQPPLTRIIKLDYEPNSGDLYISDIRGKLYKLVDGKPILCFDIAALKPQLLTHPGINTGFGSFAFHPEFTKNGLLYTTHAEAAFSGKADFYYPDSIPVTLQWILTEWTTDPKTLPFNGKGRELFRIDMPTQVHGVQEITFNKGAKPGDDDYGLLYVGIGDGGSALIGQPLVSSTPRKLWGSIIRIDPFGRNSFNGKYGIPPNNPFSKEDRTQYAGEIYAYGFRNPHRINWTKSGYLVAANIGEHHIESLNIILPGRFYGWPIREGKFEERFYNQHGRIYPLPADDSTYRIVYPAAQYDHDEGIAIAGGYEYTGKSVPQLQGKYLFGDLNSGRLFFVAMQDLKPGKEATIKEWSIKVNGVQTTLAKLCNNPRVEMRFGKDKSGEMYIFTKSDGKVYRLVK